MPRSLIPTDPKESWPPAAYLAVAEDVRKAGVWYRGIDDELAGLYGTTRTPQKAGGIRQAVKSYFGDTAGEVVNDTSPKRGASMPHMPVASDIASVSADMLFGEPVAYVIADAHAEVPDKANAAATEQAISDLAELDGWDSTLLEAAEMCSGYGGVYLVPKFMAGHEHPILTSVMPGMAVPRFENRRLVEVVFWRIVGTSDKTVYRHLERHTPGRIEHYLFKGTPQTIGTMANLLDVEATAELLNAKTGGVIDVAAIGIKGLACALVPNVLPNRAHPETGMGRSDTAGVESAMNDLDFVWQSWIRDIRLGQSRIVVPNHYLEHNGRGQGSAFDTTQEVFTPLNMEEAKDGASSITTVEFQLRVAEHEATVKALFTQIVQSAGYSPGSFGLPGEGAAQTATEVDSRDSRSERTTARKQQYWKRALRTVVFNLQCMDVAWGVGQYKPMSAEPTWPGANEINMRDTASVLNLVNLAKAASTKTRVAMLHPEWNETQVQAEADLIIAEEAPTPVADPFGVGAAPGEDDPTGEPPLSAPVDEAAAQA